MDRQTGVLLRQGETCWRLEDAERAAFLIDSADYFSALKTALLSARRSIWILAWTFDPLARLTPDRSHKSRDPEHADRLGLLLLRLAALNPALDVRVLAWDMPMGIAASQLFAPQRGKVYFHGSRVHYRLDVVLDAVTEAGASGLTVTEVRGYGRQKGKTEVYRGAEYEVKLLPKVKLEIAVSDDILDRVVEALARSANTGKLGDGKVFVLYLEQALRIRTGETDASAIAS